MASGDPCGYYKILGLSASASESAIKKRYRELALKWHPDKNQNNKEEAAEMFKKIAQAYEVLSDKDRRQRYDVCGDDGYGQGGSAGQAGYASYHANFDFNDAQRIFQMVFGSSSPFGHLSTFFEDIGSGSFMGNDRRHSGFFGSFDSPFEDMFSGSFMSSGFSDGGDFSSSFVSQSFSSSSGRGNSMYSTSTTTKTVNNRIITRTERVTTGPNGTVVRHITEKEDDGMGNVKIREFTDDGGSQKRIGSRGHNRLRR